jgi:hypothetical protein
MLLTNCDLARLCIEEWLREADHDRLVREARVALKAARPEGLGVLAACRRASALRPRKHGLRPQTGRVTTPTQRSAAHAT